ncbi:hypothetical protein NADFUDRAFT_82497 [Nadsonia fulvescens var. elongata DSM 6958]|uniref:Uncharacterized protein n=1 Tax=Nadsonia fulvescens var. elongata DSM 6958 TaxID=857566 RepID=A0A1E3PPD3_9ASCO|nr:hypothetical protein NADFUDRAFT_82497 [Nadsonia fulvescens var. elongata DSM 6958]
MTVSYSNEPIKFCKLSADLIGEVYCFLLSFLIVYRLQEQYLILNEDFVDRADIYTLGPLFI